MWTDHNQSRIFTKVKNEGFEALHTVFHDIHYTTSNKAPTKARFPTVYLHELPGSEQGRDLEGININAILCTVQIDVTDNESQSRVRRVMSEAINSMKRMRFEVISMPDYQDTDDIHKGTARFRRAISEGDII